MSQTQVSSSLKVNVRKAVQTAASYLNSFRDMLGDIKNLRLEEIELSEDKQFWLITLGFDIINNSDADTDDNPLFPLVESQNRERQYKIIKIDTQIGEVQSMKIREP
ncbi:MULTISPECIES: hypothetical protein [Spirulina sp. CCY15215]|uniref:hypothetical protein n=1 Tax=Spirulina sp. CCY15215 TaxID=2767591 RepID=UPI00194E79F8|nr:hypothetical protein [Spirulina major]